MTPLPFSYSFLTCSFIRRYGCDYYGYDTGDVEYDSQCEHPLGLGWFAAWYFAIFIVFGVFVLISLFVGVIITSMELLREGIQEENEVWKKVKLIQQTHTLDDASIDNLLEIFNLVDTGQNGKLTVRSPSLFVVDAFSFPPPSFMS